MKALTFTLLFALICSIGFSQIIPNRQIVDSLKHQLAIATQDTSRVNSMVSLCFAYRSFKLDSSLLSGEKALKLARKIKFIKGEMNALNALSGSFRIQGDMPKSLDFRIKALKMLEENFPAMDKSDLWNGIGLVYLEINDYPKALDYFRKALSIRKRENSLLNIGRVFAKTNRLDSAWYYTQIVYGANGDRNITPARDRAITPALFMDMGTVQFQMGNHRLAFEYLHKSIPLSLTIDDHRTLSDAYTTLAGFFKVSNQPDSVLYYGNKGLREAQSIGYQKGILNAADLLAEISESKDIREALYYHKIAKAANETLYGVKKVQALQRIVADEQERQREMEAQKIAEQTQLRQYAFLAGLGALFLIAFILYRTNKQQKKANHLLHRQKEEINLQRDKAEKALTELKSTQAQLIQKEKLASLGELTAGIAHEIQNPLNFVNNFSELSVDLADELEDEIKKPELDRDLIADLTKDIKSNQEKINHHGKRASSIVSGMLEHSRTSTGERTLTDINKLADEYLRLSYHGLRAKDNSFNSDYQTDFDENLPKIELISQDIGRVLLNLINNAFWAVKTVEKPLVVVKTEQTDNQIIIKVKDNGPGIPDNTKAKIFQPFFTTKPTGEGTGLGLSLAYDIVTKGHGGTLEVETKEGEGTTFIVKLPIQNS
jgi:two-component system NtrC family sensor kinase